MARLPLSTRTRKRNLRFRNVTSAIMLMYYYILALLVLSHKWKFWKIEMMIKIKELRSQRMYHLICESDVKCINDLRMDRRTFHILCDMLRDVGGLRNRTIGGFFLRSGETVSRNFNACLLAVLKLHQLLLKKPEPIPEGCTDFRWKHFKDMNQSESSSVARGRGKNKRIWTYYEDEELIKALYEISLDPKWKSEGGFKNGYCSVLENELKARLPGCGLSAIPHIESRVRHFRTKYGAIDVMLAKSGFNWDDNRKMVQCEKQQYEAHCKDNPDAKGLYGIAFPHFDTLAAIYGKDIATGEGAEGLGEAVTNMEKEIAMGEDCQVVEEDKISMYTPQRSMDNRNSDHSTSSSNKRRKKHKDSMSSDPFLDLASGIRGDHNKASQHFGMMAEVMEMEAKKDQMQELQEKSVVDLTRLGFRGSELLKAVDVFVKVPNHMTMLFAIPETLRREFILNMIADEAQKK
ncbi:hypothetical protein ZEAMMB73_Zm00001d018570 [Zea mays]|uniref:Uncharacterized protein n=1 Tax=Zea mays TaxID=4577 RepID=A0A1D6HQD9_MAIZE|nr:hypothetical protein ZEAMMB73_Zm00001d018570 [Zea mays]